LTGALASDKPSFTPREHLDHILHLGDDAWGRRVDGELVGFEPVAAVGAGELVADVLVDAGVGAEVDADLVADGGYRGNA
jgi:hypothetical protein